MHGSMHNSTHGLRRSMTRLMVAQAAVLAVSVASLSAQELRVYTRTFDITRTTAETESRAPIVARSLTLFHAGKVYDYIDSLREVTIFEPAHRRFIVLHESAGAMAMVSQDEVRHFLNLAMEESQSVTADIARQPTPESKGALELLRFQQQPEFTVTFDASQHRLKLDHPRYSYEVTTIAPPAGFTAEAYLRYADAVAELNAILHPHSLLPAPRLRLNEELRTLGELPLTVRRRVETATTVDLKAKHEWSWQLSEHDRQRISHWEAELRKKELRKLSFRQLQQEVLTGKMTQR
jgi:hypothetical protein